MRLKGGVCAIVRRQNVPLNSSGMLLPLGGLHYTGSSVTGKRIFLRSPNSGSSGFAGRDSGKECGFLYRANLCPTQRVAYQPGARTMS
jgi:hypothetical protein